jgi:hypothetical protein
MLINKIAQKSAHGKNQVPLLLGAPQVGLML